MKKLYHSSCALLILYSLAVLSSCTSMLFGKKSSSVEKDMPSDVSEYCDYHLTQYRFPDGRIADVYVFDKVSDMVFWQNTQLMAFDPNWRKRFMDDIARDKAENPLTPFAQVVSTYNSIEEQRKTGESIISYYNKQDLGELASYMTENSAAQACFEDSDGVYLLTICPPKNLNQLKNNKAEQKRHKGEFGYEVAYLPRKAYSDITPPKLTPAKVTPVTPSSLPNSDRNLNPVSPTGSGAYYYDADVAYQLQWLAVKIACKGVYDMAYTGDFRARNPTDYYKTSFIKSYLAKEGVATKGTTLFEGICFDYADFAYQELNDNRKNYSSRIASFSMVGTFEDSNDIIVYKIAEKGETSNMTINRTPVVAYSHNHIRAHENATSHAWFWVWTVDGTVYWVDPTWTDNRGRPVYGIVRGGQEVQLEPDSRLSVR